MKRLLLLFLLLPGSLWATTTVTGKIQNLGTGNISGAFVRFWLRGCAGNQPRVSSTSVIGPTQGGIFYFDFPADVNGNVSGTLYSTRDSTGLLSGDIECGGSTTAVWYGMQIWNAGKPGPEIPVHANSGTILNISNVTPLITTPTVGPGQVLTQSFNCPIASPTTTWTCVHNFADLNVEVMAYDLNGKQIFPDTLTITDSNTVTLTWVTAQAGKAIVMHGSSVVLATSQPNAIISNPVGSQSITGQALMLASSVPLTTQGTGLHSGAETFTGTLTAKQVNSVINVDGITYTGVQALQSAIQACSGLANCIVDARNPLIGTQTFTVNPLSGLNMPITLYTGPYTVQWDHAAFYLDYPSNFHWIGSGTKVLNSSGSTGVATSPIPRILGLNYFFGSRIYSTTCTVTSGSQSVTVASATNLQVGAMLMCIGAAGPNTLQATATNGATGTGTSFTVNQTTGWDIGGTKDNYLQIENEQMFCSGGTGTTFTGCTRGINGTTNVSHANGITVNAITGLISEILNISGTTVTVADTASATVTGAQAYSGVANSSLEGSMIFDGNQTVSGTMRFLAGISIVLSGNIHVDQGIQFVRWDQGGVTLLGSRNNYIFASHYQTNGKPPNALGWDIGIFESSSNNNIKSLSSGFGVDAAGIVNASDIGVFIDDRSTNSTPFDGPSNDNTVDLGSLTNPTTGVSIQSGCSRNHVRVGKIKILSTGAGTGIIINYDSDWIVNGVATNVTPVGNSVYFDAIDGTGSVALTTLGYTGTGQNLIFGGAVLGGSTGCITGDYCSYLNSSGQRNLAGNAKEFFTSYARSGGGAAFPDITGDSAHALVLGDAFGVRIGSSAFLDLSSGSSVRVNNTNPTAANSVMLFTAGGGPSFSSGPIFPSNTAALTADWTCGTGGTVSSCTSATIIGSGGGVPLTFTLPLVAQSYTLECDGVVGQATAATANNWNLLTATNGVTNTMAFFDMYTAAGVKAMGATTGQGTTTTTFNIGGTWTLGGTATKMPFHIYAKLEGASASGTVVSLQLIAPTVADLVTIYRGTACRLF